MAGGEKGGCRADLAELQNLDDEGRGDVPEDPDLLDPIEALCDDLGLQGWRKLLNHVLVQREPDNASSRGEIIIYYNLLTCQLRCGRRAQ